MLFLNRVTRQFGGLTALNHVSMGVHEGRVVGLIGPNGAGKTTLINCITGLDHPTSGSIRFRDVEVQQKAAHRIVRLGMSRTYQNIRLFGEMTALENLIVAQHQQGDATLLHALFWIPPYSQERRRQVQRGMELLERFHLINAANVPAGNLPYGDQRRLEMARTIATNPRLVLLDEPTAGMNPVETQELGEQILRMKADGMTLLVVEHDMSLISQVVDEIYVLSFGEIIAHGTYQEIRQNPEVIEAYLGHEE